MSTDTSFTKENLDFYLKELGKEYQKLNRAKVPAEIILIGGAAILANYGFRESTYDIDAIIFASTAMKEAINRVGDKLGLPNGWLNTDFTNTKSYSDKLVEVSVYYKTFSNVLTVRIVSAEYLIAMKLMSGREYKFDLSDIVGILLEHKRSGNPISREVIHNAVMKLYGGIDCIPDVSKKFLDDAFENGDYERVYRELRESEKKSEEMLLQFNQAYPGELKGENIGTILEKARQKRKKGDTEK
ncbi:MAG TPA: hypothetical protein DDZ89_14355 [Clostridiales bacterium]|nr:hypothetical protein [Clostridiales bacterium]